MKLSCQQQHPQEGWADGVLGGREGECKGGEEEIQADGFPVRVSPGHEMDFLRGACRGMDGVASQLPAIFRSFPNMLDNFLLVIQLLGNLWQLFCRQNITPVQFPPVQSIA